MIYVRVFIAAFEATSFGVYRCFADIRQIIYNGVSDRIHNSLEEEVETL